MGNNYSIYFDIGVLLLLIVFMYSGGKKGFVRTVVIVVGYVLSVAIASFVSKNATDIVYDSFIKESVTNSIESKFEDVNTGEKLKELLNSIFSDYGVSVSEKDTEAMISSNDIGKSISDYMNSNYKGANVSAADVESKIKDGINESALSSITDSIPNFLKKSAESFINNGKWTSLITMGDKRAAAEFVEENLVRGVVSPLISTIIFMLVFFILMAIVRVISRSLRFIKRIPLIGSANTLLGVGLGVIEGLIIIYIICMMLRLAIAFTGDSMVVLSNETIDNTLILKRIYYFNFINI